MLLIGPPILATVYRKNKAAELAFPSILLKMETVPKNQTPET